MEKKLNTKIFIHADDYGRSEMISKNIVRCIDSGSINSVSIMIGSNKEVYKEIKKYNINAQNVEVRIRWVKIFVNSFV